MPWYLLCAGLAWADAGEAERDRVLVVASVAEVEPLRSDLRRAPERSAAIVGVLFPATAGRCEKPACNGPIFVKAIEVGATVLVLNHQAEADPSIIDQAAELHGRGLRVRSYSLFTDEWLGKVLLGI